MFTYIKPTTIENKNNNKKRREIIVSIYIHQLFWETFLAPFISLFSPLFVQKLKVDSKLYS